VILALAVGLAGGLGSVARYLVDGAVGDRSSGVFPYGTLTVNVIGSLVLGALTGVVAYHGVSPRLRIVVGTGGCGGLTTWSTFSWENVRLAADGHLRPALANALGGLAASVAAGAIGFMLGAW